MIADPIVAWLHDHEELRRLHQRYARAVDGRDIDALAGIFHPDGSVDGARGLATVPEYLAALRASSPTFGASMHVLADPLIDLEVGATTGRTDTYAVVHQLGRVDAPERDLVLGIRYLDEVARHEQRWTIRHRKAVTLWTRASSSAGEA